MILKHYILTRFNIGYRNKLPKKIDKNEWLSERINLFFSYTYPSIQNQTVQTFNWILLIDYDTPSKFIQLIKKRDKARLLKIEKFQDIEFYQIKELSKALVTRIMKESNINTRYIVTTRIDSDDIVSENFIEEIQNSILIENKVEAPYIISVPYGYCYNTKNKITTQYYYESNPFITLVENNNKLRTVFFTQHTNATKLIKTVKLDNKAFFIQVIHGRNLKNSMTGDLKLVLSAPLKSLYEKLNLKFKSPIYAIPAAIQYYFNKLNIRIRKKLKANGTVNQFVKSQS